mgnify:CR=1 FL=1
MNTPLISVVSPFYGSTKLLKRCLDSLAAQTDGDFEVVVVDDCSPTSGRETVEAYDSRFRYVRQDVNKGPYQARVRGIEEALGDYVVHVDFDDYVKPELVAELRKAIEANRADIVVYNLEQDWGSGDIRPHWCHYEKGLYTSEEAIRRIATGKLQYFNFARAIRREMILRMWRDCPGLHDFRVWTVEDYSAIMPIILAARTIEVIDYVGYRYYQTPDSISRVITLKKVRQACRETRESARLTRDYAKSLGRSAADIAALDSLERTIVKWWLLEFWRVFKLRVKHLFVRF